MQFRLWLENQRRLPLGADYILLASLRGNSFGTAGGGPSQERSASLRHAIESAGFEVSVKNPENLRLIQGAPVEIYDGSWGSFHEQAVRVTAYAIVDTERYDKVAETEAVSGFDESSRSRRNVSIAHFQGVEQLREAMVKVVENTLANDYAALSKEKRTEYLDRIMQQYRKTYVKRKVEGD